MKFLKKLDIFVAKRQRGTSLPIDKFSLKSANKVYVLTERHCVFIAKLIKTNLSRIGISIDIIHEMPVNGFSKGLYFVICPQSFKKLPKVFVAFQMEQLVCSNWLSAKYLRKLKSAVAVFDYSLLNIEFLKKNSIESNRLLYMPIFYNTIPEPADVKKEYDVLFYGGMNCQRRKDILAEIGKCYKIKIIDNMYGAELLKEIAKAKIVLNIHYYEGALLETTRISECLSLNSGVIVSEKGIDSDINEHFDKFIDFVEINDVEMIKKRIAYWLDDEERIKEKLYKNYLIAKGSEYNLFEDRFYKFLLLSKNIDNCIYEQLSKK